MTMLSIEQAQKVTDLLDRIRKNSGPVRHYRVVYAPKGTTDIVRLLVEFLSLQAVIDHPEQRLAFAVLTDAIFDLTRPARFAGDRRRAKTLDWFHYGYHEGWCQLTGLNSTWLVTMLVRCELLTDRKVH